LNSSTATTASPSDVGSVPSSATPAAPVLPEDLAGVEEVVPAHPALLDDEAGALGEPEETDDVPPGPSAVPQAAGPKPRIAEAVAKDLGRARRRVRQQLRDAKVSEDMRRAFDAGTRAGVPDEELRSLVEELEREKMVKGGFSKRAAGEWAGLARTACEAALAAVVPVVVEPIPVATPAPAQATPPPPPQPVTFKGLNADLVAKEAGSVLWVLESLAEMTAGKKLDLMKPRERVLFKGHAAERKVTGDPVSRLTELWAVTRAESITKKGPNASPEAPIWEVAAYVAALVCAVAPEDPAATVSKVKALFKTGSTGAARALRGLAGKLKNRRSA
jgi:hypothetical protein